MSSQVAPRQPPPLYIPQGHLNNPSGLASASGNMHNIPITPYQGSRNVAHSPTRLSRFSPTTPDLEKGKGGLYPSSSLSKRFKRLRQDTSSSSNTFASKPEPGGGRRAWVLKCLLGVLLLLLIGNVIYLDIRLILPSKSTPLSASDTSQAAGENAPQTSSSSSSPVSSSGSSSVPPPPQPTVDPAQRNLALNCVSQFPGNTSGGAQAFCNRCMPALNTIPTNFFPPGSQQADAYTKANVFCRTAF